MSMLGEALEFYRLLRDIYKNRQILSAMFDWEGKRVSGDARIGVEKLPYRDKPHLWIYRIKTLEDYQFIRIPVNAGSVAEVLGSPEPSPNASAEYFRYVEARQIGASEPHNVKASFMVFGYRPNDLLEISSGAHKSADPK